jgi:hypothetical protein
LRAFPHAADFAVRTPRFVTRCTRAFALASTVAALLAACGGGDDGNAPEQPAAACTVEAQKSWLATYMDDQYLWYATKPNPDPAPYTDVASYFEALKTPGVAGDPNLPQDVWSYTTPSAVYSQFYDEGRTLGYGLAVAGLEVQGQPERPLRVRHVEAKSPAAEAGLKRGDTLVSINGVPASNVIAGDDYSVLTPALAGDVLRLVVRDAQGTERDVDLAARVFELTPLADARIVQSPAGTPIGYVALKDFISQATAPLENAFASFKADGVRELVLDLRYNGGGLVSMAGTLASYAVGARAADQTFALLRHNDKQQARNSPFRFGALASALGASRVFVLSGARTCSASELVINGLEPFVQVVQIGDVTCGKPVGFVPVDRCGTTFSAVSFESVNAVGEGRYWDGLAPHCAVADDLDHPLGDRDEALLAAAHGYVDGGACPAASARERPQRLRDRQRRIDEGERPATMIDR